MTELSTFANPPIVETVLGAQFEPIAELRNAHLGLFAEGLSGDWRMLDELPPLPTALEEFPASWGRSRAKLQLTQNPTSRLRIGTSDESRVIQVQNTRLHLNWAGAHDYPRFERLMPEFLGMWSQFKSFLSSRGLGEPLVNQWEVTYVNRVARGELWDSPSQWGRVFDGLLPREIGDESLETVQVLQRFEIKPQRGRLYVELEGGSDANGEQAMLLRLTARGGISAEETLEDGIRLGRHSVVKKFIELSSDEAKEFWGEHR